MGTPGRPADRSNEERPHNCTHEPMGVETQTRAFALGGYLIFGLKETNLQPEKAEKRMEPQTCNPPNFSDVRTSRVAPPCTSRRSSAATAPARRGHAGKSFCSHSNECSYLFSPEISGHASRLPTGPTLVPTIKKSERGKVLNKGRSPS